MAAPKGHPKYPGAGRKPGTPNKVTKALKDAILAALDLAKGLPVEGVEQLGAVPYLARQSEENPVAFMGLIGKVLPLTLAGEGQDGALVVEIRRFTQVEADRPEIASGVRNALIAPDQHGD